MKFLLYSLMFCMASLLLCAEEPSISDKIEEYMQAAGKVWGFTGAVLVSHKDEPVYVNGIGKASIQLNVPNDSRNLFRIGELTKQFTAAAALKLAQNGLIELNAPIGKYLEDYPAQTSNKVTVHHLLSNTSGIPDFINDPKFIKSGSQGLSLDELVALFSNQALQFEPGEKFNDSNSNYVLLGMIVSAVSGIPLEAYVKQNILDPLDLKATGYYSQPQVIPQMANGYSLNAQGQVINAPCAAGSGANAIRGMFSNVGDLFVWSQALLQDKVIGPYMRKLMFTPYKGNYGYGWRIDNPQAASDTAKLKNYGKLHFWHEGGVDGFYSLLSIYPNEKIEIILLSNNDLAFKNAQMLYTIHNALAAIILNQPYILPMESVLFHP